MNPTITTALNYLNAGAYQKFFTKLKQVLPTDMVHEYNALMAQYAGVALAPNAHGLLQDFAQRIDARLKEGKEVGNKGVLRVLMFTANPQNTTQLELTKEIVAVQNELQENENIRLRTLHHTTFANFMRIVRKTAPHILHFSGHGTAKGIVFEQENSTQSDLVTSNDLENVFAHFKSACLRFDAVVLNACYTETQSDIILRYVPFVICTTDAIKDDHAIAFSKEFYACLCENPHEIKTAFEAGRVMAVHEGADFQDFILRENNNL